MLLYQKLAFPIHRKIQNKNSKFKITNSNKNSRFKISALTWNEEFELLDESFSVLDVQDYYKYLKKHEAVSENSSIMIYVNKIENRSMFKMKTW